jgi:hypothetical protein
MGGRQPRHGIRRLTRSGDRVRRHAEHPSRIRRCPRPDLMPCGSRRPSDDPSPRETPSAAPLEARCEVHGCRSRRSPSSSNRSNASSALAERQTSNQRSRVHGVGAAPNLCPSRGFLIRRRRSWRTSFRQGSRLCSRRSSDPLRAASRTPFPLRWRARVRSLPIVQRTAAAAAGAVVLEVGAGGLRASTGQP